MSVRFSTPWPLVLLIATMRAALLCACLLLLAGFAASEKPKLKVTILVRLVVSCAHRVACGFTQGVDVSEQLIKGARGATRVCRTPALLFGCNRGLWARPGPAGPP